MVGGSVRDLILGRPSTDYDIVVRGNPEKFARKLSENLSGHLVKMGKPGQVVFRVVSGEHLFDISAIKGPNIETDLVQRINDRFGKKGVCYRVDRKIPLNKIRFNV